MDKNRSIAVLVAEQVEDGYGRCRVSLNSILSNTSKKRV
jgi:hypothetical protein